MKVQKPKIKVIAGFLAGILIAGGIGAYAEYKYMATDIKYTNEKSVAQALNELYANKKNTSDEAKSITANGSQTLDKYYKNLNVNVTVAGTKTLLWTNTNSSSTFDSQIISLSDSITKYTHFILEWKPYTNSAVIYEDVFKVTPLRYANNSSNGCGRYVYGSNNSLSIGYTRTITCVENNTSSLDFGKAWNISSNTNDNDAVIPYRIYGLNISY